MKDSTLREDDWRFGTEAEYVRKLRNTVQGETDGSLRYLLKTTLPRSTARAEVEREIWRRAYHDEG
jgi:hypothetical protein